MHVTDVIYFPFLYVMCNMLISIEKMQEICLGQVKLLCFSNEHVALNVTKNTGLSTDMQSSKPRKIPFSEQSYAMRSHDHSWDRMVTFLDRRYSRIESILFH